MPRFKFQGLALLAALLSAGLASGADLAARGWSSRVYRAEDGLPASLIFALAQDPDGYLWLGTASGLVRFDGLQFVTWGAHGEPALPYREVRALMAGREGGLWIGFNEGGILSRLLDGNLVTYTRDDGLPGGVLFPKVQDRDGNVWAAGPAGVAIFRSGRWEQLQGRFGLPSFAAFTVFEDRAGTIWVATTRGVFRRSYGQRDFVHVVDDLIQDFSEDRAGRLFVTDYGRGLRPLSASEPATADRVAPPTRLTGSLVLHDQRGDVWVGSTAIGGLMWMSARAGGAPMKPTLTSRVTSDIVMALMEDRDGNIWAGTTRGLLRLYPSSVETLGPDEGLPSSNVRVVTADPKGGVWVGTSAGLTRITLGSAIDAVRAPEPLAHTAIRTISADPRGRVWVSATTEGVDLFGILNHGTFSPAPWSGITRLGAVAAVVPDRDGDAWICPSNEAGVYRSRHGTVEKFDAGTELAGKSCTAGLLDRKGRVWIGFDDGSLIVTDGAHADTHVSGRAIPRGRVCAMYEDRAGDIWIATTAGVSRFRNGVFSTLGARHGLPGEYFSAIIDDDSDDLWIGVNTGLIRLKKREFDRSVSDPQHRPAYTLFDSSDGVNDPPACYGASTAARDDRGRLWFAGVNGAIVIDPKQIQDSRPVVRPVIERVVADGNPLAATAKVALPPRTSRIEVNYTAVSLSAASKIRFRYRLEGFDAPWTDAGMRRQAFYTNLPPGEYRFLLEANINGSTESTAAWSFSIQPAFYQTLPFYAAAGAVVMLAAWSAWRLRLTALHHRFARIGEERARIAREIHDSVLQNMAGVALQLEGLTRKARVAPELVGSDLKAISRDVKRHVAEARHVIWDLRSPTADKPLPETLQELADQVLAGTDIKLDTEISGRPVAFPGEVEEQILRVAGEAMRNVVGHARASRIRLRVLYEPDGVRLAIADDGCGFDVDLHPIGTNGHWGVTGMRERANKIGAELRIESQSGVGTSVELTVPRTAHT